MRSPTIISLFALTAISFSMSNQSIYAQMSNQQAAGNPGMGMILLPVQRGADGQQYITTQAGYRVAVPGVGIDANATQIATFRDPQNNFWYINKDGQSTPVSAQQMQSIMSQVQQQQTMRQGSVVQSQQTVAPTAVAPAAAPQQSGSSGNSAMVSGLAAAGGAAVGAGVVNAFNNNNNQYPSYGYGGTPYGQPIYKAPTGQYYYNNPSTGAHSYVTPTASTSAYYNQYEQQQQQKQQFASQAYSTNQANQASQQKQMTPQEAQAVQSKEGQESGRRRLGRGHSDQMQGGQAVQDEQSEKRGRLSGRNKADEAIDGQQKLRRRRAADN